MTNKYKILLSLPFLLIGIAAYKIDANSLKQYNTSFISIALTIATFSISFSFLQYQFSPYKALLKSISKRQLLFSFLTILTALTPLVTLFIDTDLVPNVSLFAIPILTYLFILLLVISNDESNPVYLLNRTSSKRNYRFYIKHFKDEFAKYTQSQKELNFSRGDEQPMHDFGDEKFQLTHFKNDPYILINNIIEISLKNSDLETFEKVIKKFFELLEKSTALEEYKNSDFKFRLQNHINTCFARIAYSTSSLTENKIYHNRFLDISGTYLKRQALIQEQVNPVNLEIVQALTSFATNILKTNSNGSLYVTSLFRQLAQKGIYDNVDKNDSRMFNHYLSSFASLIKVIGQEAIKMKDSDFLYRCLEELGYLGCTAIKSNHYPVGIECLQSLVQLGRGARANGLKCFWRHCMLETIDHADERLWWMLSWVPHLDEKSVDQWIESFTTAYSRLHGFKKQILKEQKDNRTGFRFVETKEPYIESFSKEHYFRNVDYSDFAETKEFKLY